MIARFQKYRKQVGRRIVKRFQPVRYSLKSWTMAFRSFYRKHELPMRVTSGLLAGLFLVVLGIEVQQYRLRSTDYDISAYEGTLLDQPMTSYANKLQFDAEQATLAYNDNYQPNVDVTGQVHSPKITAYFYQDPQDGVRVIDPVNNVGITMKPLFETGAPQKNINRVVYPLAGNIGAKVYTLQANSIKEDIILREYQSSEMSFSYELELEDGLEARLEPDGSLGIYGINSSFLGDVATGSAEDEQLLEEFRNNAEKSQLLFRVPAPFIVEEGQQRSQANAWFRLKESVLTVHADDLDKANYPLSIDPSVYVETAAKLMRGNNESNIDFDVDNELIQKGSTTGARFDEWLDTMFLQEGRNSAGVAVTGGFVYVVGGASAGVGGGGPTAATFDTAGSFTYDIPVDVNEITIQAWGGGGGGGGASSDRIGGDGGGGGFASSTISVTPSETLDIYVGGDGQGGTGSTGGTASGDGGGGGGYSGAFRSGTPLIVAGGGAGGGGGNGDSGGARQPGEPGGPGGGTTGIDGSNSGSTTGGGGGTQSAGGAGGTSGGSTGASLQGGDGGSPDGGAGGAGGTNGGGDGGQQENKGGPNKRPAGGGGGAGYYGGGGGGGRDDRYDGGAGGGGGSSYTTGTLETNVAGSGQNPGNAGNDERNGAAEGGAGGGAGEDGTDGTDGLVLIGFATGEAGDTVHETVYWAEFNPENNEIQSPNPGDGTCVNWCSSSVYDLPEKREGLSLVAYNGFLYAFGGYDVDRNRQDTVYIAKLGANGEPSLWHPTDGNPNNWDYWYEDTSLSSELVHTGVTAYNNRMYRLGGQTDSDTGGVSTVEYADINPTGTLGTWTTTGMSVLPSDRYSHSVHAYNDRLYVIGGNSNGTLQNTVHYSRLNNDGTMNNWVQTESFDTARMAVGGSFTTVWGGYIYLSGGCSATNVNDYCTGIQDDVQLASINADGSITDWNTILGLTNQRIGHSMVAWRNAIYGIGGCSVQDPDNGLCTSIISVNDLGIINQDGDASTVSNSVPPGTAPCSGTDPFDCDIPPEGDGNGEGGRMAGGALVNNGYIYHIGGCYLVGGSNICNTGNDGRSASTISYAQIAPNGTLIQPDNCTGTNTQYAGSWCVDNDNRINSGDGLAGFAHTVFNNTIYVIGGTTGADWQDNVWRVELNADGSLNTWQSQSFTDTGLGDNKGYQYAFTRANPDTAGTFPGNLYVLGGCRGDTAGSTGLECTTFFTEVYKCKIDTSGALGTSSDTCTTTGQLQLDSEPGTAGSQGLGTMAGTVYANYVYLIGGQSPNETERGQVMYAQIDNSNNIVAASGSDWTTSPYELDPVRKRGVAFGYNGYLYALAGNNEDDDSLNDLLFAKIDVSDGSINPFNTSLVTVNPRWDLRSVVNNGFVYALGGCSDGVPPATCNSMTGIVQTFQLYNNWTGEPAEYSSGANTFATDRLGGGATVLDGYIYVAGGCTSTTDCSVVTDSVQYAELNPDGSVGTWSATTADLTAGRAYGQLEAVGDTLYFIGGQNASDTAQSSIYYAQPGSAGDVSSWSTATNSLPAARTEVSATSWNGRLYVAGGRSGSTYYDTVYYSPDLSAGGDISSAWSTTEALVTERAGHTLISYANNLYLLGGYDGANYLNDVQYAQINSNGTIGTWANTTSLPQRIRNGDGFAANGYMYMFGGRSDDTVCTTNTYVAPISANTTIATGNDPTGIGEWYQTNQAFGGERYGVAATYDDGRAYLLGGGCGSTISYTGTDRVTYSSLQSQPQIARYSRMIDTDTDVFPTNWLINGLDNDIGARWFMRYRSSTAATGAWGQETNFGRVVLGQPEEYTPLDGSGTDTEFARYFYFSLNIDSSQAYGYPDDVTRGPTITDISLFFTSDPGKRLRHGKTFTGGELQPLNTPF